MIIEYLLFCTITVIIIFLSCNLFYHLTSLFIWPPSIPTDTKTTENILQFIDLHTSIDNNALEIADLGSGCGHLLFRISKKYPHTHITGYEILTIPCLISKIITYILRYKNISIIKKDLLISDLSKFDIIICFLCGSINSKLSIKLQKEAKKNCLIISNNFPIPNLHKVTTIQIQDIFSKRTIYIYKIL